ncbi:hypothetical protein [Siminovitchia acidinfaciens]|nr:hypothetical protein [Siminovitchia acidinfaciens]
MLTSITSCAALQRADPRQVGAAQEHFLISFLVGLMFAGLGTGRLKAPRPVAPAALGVQSVGRLKQLCPVASSALGHPVRRSLM